MNGYWGKILKVDLSTGEITVEEPPESFYRRYLGGSGLIGYYLLKEVPKGADPLGPENVLDLRGGPGHRSSHRRRWPKRRGRQVAAHRRLRRSRRGRFLRR